MKPTRQSTGMKRVIFLAVTGAAIVTLGELPILPSNPMLHILLTTFGSILIGTSIIDGGFQLQFHRKIQEQVDSLSSSIFALQNTVMIAKGAVEAGLTAVYATREECLNKIKEKLVQALRSADGRRQSKPIQISILGISLGDFLCPHGSLQPTFRELLKSKRFQIKIAVLADGSDAAMDRAIHEESGKFVEVLRRFADTASEEGRSEIVKVYETTKCHDELKTATDYLRDLTARHKIDRDKPLQDAAASAGLEAYTYSAHPMAFIFAMDDEMFIESYHLAGRGGEAPILQVSKFKNQTKQANSEESKLYRIYKGHFDSIISRSVRISPLATNSACNFDKGMHNRVEHAGDPQPT